MPESKKHTVIDSDGRKTGLEMCIKSLEDISTFSKKNMLTPCGFWLVSLHNQLHQINTHTCFLHTQQFHKPFTVNWLAVIVDKSVLVYPSSVNHEPRCCSSNPTFHNGLGEFKVCILNSVRPLRPPKDPTFGGHTQICLPRSSLGRIC